MKNKVWFIPITQGFSARYVLSTGILSEALAAGVQIVLLTPHPDDFAAWRSDQIHVENYEIEKCRQFFAKASRLAKFLVRVRYFTLSHRGDLGAMDARVKIERQDAFNQKGQPRGRFKRGLLFFIVFFARRSVRLRKILLAWETCLIDPSIHEKLFKKWQPDLLVTTSLGVFDFDHFWLREARKYGVPSVAVLQSWDNPSSKGYLGAVPDHAIVWTPVMKQELITLNDVPAERISVGGVAHFGRYFATPPRSRDAIAELKKKYGLDPARPLILMGTKSPSSTLDNVPITQKLLTASRTGKFKNRPQILLRVHPIYYRQRQNVFLFADALAEIRALARENADLFLSEPSLLKGTTSYLMPHSEMDTIRDLLEMSDVVVNFFSTLNIEAAIFDRPIVNVAFHLTPPGTKKARYDLAIDMAAPHNKRIIQSGAVYLAKSPEDLVVAVNRYLEHPETDREKRHALVAQEIGEFRENAAANVGHLLVQFAHSVAARRRAPDQFL